MNTSDINAYLLNGEKASQKVTMQASVPFSFLKDHVRFSYMTESTFDPYAFDSDNIESLRNVSKDKYYQRRVDERRVGAIKKYIRESILDEKNGVKIGVLFPTSLLLSAVYEESLPESGQLPLNQMLSHGNDFFIVDGQHRLWSMIDLYQEITDLKKNSLFLSDEDEYLLDYLNRYRFNCTILLNYDLWEQARIFADVNFNQRKVSRSLYYAIYGMWYSDNPKELRNNYIFIAHQLVNFLNSSQYSPIKGMVRMLGNGKGMISQAFLADSLILHIQSPRGIWYVDSLDRGREGAYVYMAKEIITYLTFIRNHFSDFWPSNNSHRSILLKTTGIGALIRLMGYIHKNYLSDEIIDSINMTGNDYVNQAYYDRLSYVMSPLKRHASSLFGFDGEFAGTGGKGLEGKLYRRMIRLIETGENEIIEATEAEINGIKVKILKYKDKEGIYSFELSHYFQNPDQGMPYRPGGGSLGSSKDQLDFRLRLYIEQVTKDAKAVVNGDFDHNEWKRSFHNSNTR